MKPINSIGREAAIKLAESKWWEGLPAREVAEFQLFTRELCMDFGAFHQAVEESLGRSVFTHEFGLDYEGICKEFLGERTPPTLEGIIALIPEEKRIIVQSSDTAETGEG